MSWPPLPVSLAGTTLPRNRNVFLITFPKCPSQGRWRHVKFSANSFNSLLLRSLASSTTPTRLRCNDSFIHPSRRTHPRQKYVRRHEHDQTSAHARTPADFVSHHSQDIPEQQVGRKTLMHLELLAQIVLSSSTCPIVLLLLPLIIFCQRGCLSFCPLRADFLYDVTARCVRMSNRHLLIISVPGFHGHISCTSLNSSSFPLSDSLSPSDSVLVCIHPCFSHQGSLNDRSDSLSAFVLMWLCRFSMRCKRCASWAASSVSVGFSVRRQNVESSRLNLWRSFNHNPRQWGSRSFLDSCDLLRQLQFWSHHLPRSTTQPFPIRRFPSITKCLSSPTLASHNSILGNAQNCSCSIMKTNQDSLSHAARKCTDTIFSSFTEPNFLSKLRHWLSPSSTSSAQFTRFSIFANPHFVHDLRCQTKKPNG